MENIHPLSRTEVIFPILWHRMKGHIPFVVKLIIHTAVCSYYKLLMEKRADFVTLGAEGEGHMPLLSQLRTGLFTEGGLGAPPLRGPRRWLFVAIYPPS